MLEPETKKLAIQHRIPCHQPEKIRKNKEFHATLEQYGADYFVVCAYGKILPKVVLDIPKKHCLNIHFSDLPEYRGMAPVQFALLDGIDRTAIAIQIMAEGMDEGDVVATLSVEIGMFDTT